MASIYCGSRATAFSGSSLGVRSQRVARGVAGAVMRKQGIHPEWFDEAKVIHNGTEVMTVGGTKKVYNVDVYSGNHPFYQGVKSMVVMDDGQLNKFKKRFADLEELSIVPNLPQGKAVDEDKPKAAAGKKGKKK